MKVLRAEVDAEDLSPLRNDIVTVGFPGFMSSRAQMAKYCGPDGVTVLDRSTHRPLFHTKCRVAPRILHNCMPLPEVEELVYEFSLNPHHWLTMLRTAMVRWYFELRPLPTSYMALNKVNLGGRVDQEQCIADVELAVRQITDSSDGIRTKKIVMFGCSRGATTTLYAALNLPAHLAKHVGLVLVEAPFDTMKNVFDESMWFPKLGMALMKLFGKYEGEHVYSMPQTTHLHCPIAFVSSKKDKRVPPVLTRRLIAEVRERFPQLPVYHLELEHSSHATMSIGHPDDQDAYVKFVDMLYDRYIGAAATNARAEQRLDSSGAALVS